MMINLLLINFKLYDFIDIVVIAILLYQLYSLLKGTAAIKIAIGIIIIYIIWIVVQAFHMEILGSILGQVIGVGMIALIVVFQQEIRKFLLLIGNKYLSGNTKYLSHIKAYGDYSSDAIDNIINATVDMSYAKTGALIVIARSSSLKSFTEYGEIINADINTQLLKQIFYKNSPLHDGAVLIEKNRIYAAKCILPVSENPKLQQEYGLRHRSALGMSEVADCIVIVVSEQTGNISLAHDSKIMLVSNKERLQKIIISYLERKNTD